MTPDGRSGWMMPAVCKRLLPNQNIRDNFSAVNDFLKKIFIFILFGKLFSLIFK